MRSTQELRKSDLMQLQTNKGRDVLITVDLDNDQIRIGEPKYASDNDVLCLPTGPRTTTKQVGALLYELINALGSAIDGPVDTVTIREQSDGEYFTVDEWSMR